MFLRPFLWPIADAAQCGRPSGCRLSISLSRFPSRLLGRLAIASKQKPGHGGMASAPADRHMAKKTVKINPVLHFRARLAYQPARQEDPDARIYLSGPG